MGSREGPADATLLRDCYDAAIAAVQPAICLGRALPSAPAPGQPLAFLAIGKAAPGMAQTFCEWVGGTGARLISGLVIAAEQNVAPLPAAVRVATGDHPVPGHRSAAAADAIADWIASLPPDVTVHALLSGGTSSLIAAPLPPLDLSDLQDTFCLLLGSGLDIHVVNAIRKRMLRWSAGRLALALANRSIHVWAISDVPGDDPGSIGSGPFTGDRWHREEIAAVVESSSLRSQLRPLVLEILDRETVKPGDPRLAQVSFRVVASNRTATAAALAQAQRAGRTASVLPELLTGDAAAAGVMVARAIAGRAAGEVLIWGGETTVALTPDSGTGGRSQELALAAAIELDRLGAAATVLAAGTDGRDGPTDAAGAIVDAAVAARIRAGGIDPVSALARHDSHTALERADALLRTGPSGTNVMDLVLAISG